VAESAVLRHADLVAFLPVTDLLRAATFCTDVLGLVLVEDTPYAAVFESNGVRVRVTLVPELVPAPFTVLGWEVPDIAATVTELTGRGARFERFEGMDQDELGVWRSPDGDQVAWFKDPEGNVLSLTQAGG
jgi:catechol 2,3-dioxygenase-like lactoylglutathione lyase family enzyme